MSSMSFPLALGRDDVGKEGERIGGRKRGRERRRGERGRETETETEGVREKEWEESNVLTRIVSLEGHIRAKPNS